MIKCPACNSNMIVTNTINERDCVIRRRVCDRCGEIRFTIEEIVEQETETGLQKFINSMIMREV